jgi:hypothetical protein
MIAYKWDNDDVTLATCVCNNIPVNSFLIKGKIEGL